MPKIAREMSPLEVSRLKRPGFHAVGGVPGLYLQVTDSGARSWVLRTKIGDKRRDMGLGGFPGVTLAMARDKARERRKQIESGINPIAERKAVRAKLAAAAAKQKTFDEAARLYVTTTKAPELSNAKHRAQWATTLETYALPVIGKLPVDMIETGHITTILSPIWLEKTETATRLRQRIEAVIDFTIANEWRTAANPARWKGHLDKILAKPAKVKTVRPMPALPIDRMAEFMADLRRQEGIAARALELLTLTAMRSGPVREAAWSEIDLEAAVWTIPAGKMKARREFRVPLSADAVALLRALPRIASRGDLVFPSPHGGGPLSDMTLLKCIARMHARSLDDGGEGYGDPRQNGRMGVPHGFRSTFRDWIAERTSWPGEVAEKALAHEIKNKVESAYRRDDLLEKRRLLMEDWARLCRTPRPAGTVVDLQKARA